MSSIGELLERCPLASDFLKTCGEPQYNYECARLKNNTEKPLEFCTTALPVKRDPDDPKKVVPILAGSEADATEFVITRHKLQIEPGECHECQMLTLARGCCTVVCKEGLPAQDPCGDDYDLDALQTALEAMNVVVRSVAGNLSMTQTT